MNYIELKTLEDDGEERSALQAVVAQSLDEAAEQGVNQVSVVMRYQRLLPQTGRYDNPRPVRPLKVNASTADADRLVDQILARLKEAFGRGFSGRVVVGVEDPENTGEPLAGVWDRNIQFGDHADDPYGMTGGPEGGGGGMGLPPGGGGGYGGGMSGGMGGGMGGGGGSYGPPPGGHGPPGFYGSSMQHGPPGMSMGGGMGGGGGFAGSMYDPGALGKIDNPEDRELVRSVIGAQERRADMMAGELRARDDNFFRMLDYNLKQNHQFMQMLGLVFGRWVPPAQQAAPPAMHPIVGMLTGLLGMFFPPPPNQPQLPQSYAPPPPAIQPPPPHQPSFYEPAGDPADLDFGPGDMGHGPSYGGSMMGGSMQGGSFNPAAGPVPWQPPQNEEQWAQAMQADPEGAKRAAAKLVGPPWNKLLGGG